VRRRFLHHRMQSEFKVDSRLFQVTTVVEHKPYMDPLEWELFS
jgi:hypothetical protein